MMAAAAAGDSKDVRFQLDLIATPAGITSKYFTIQIYTFNFKFMLRDHSSEFALFKVVSEKRNDLSSRQCFQTGCRSKIEVEVGNV